MRLLLVRHAEADSTVLLGRLDKGLSDRGRKQAEALAEALKKEKMEAIYSSDLGRARETAEIINRHHGLRIHFTEELRERDFGEFSGKTREAFLKAVRNSGKEYHEFKPGEGESGLEVQKRVVLFFERLGSHRGTVLVVSHGGVMMQFLFHVTGIPREEYEKVHVDNTGLCEIVTDGERLVVKRINDLSHL